jgi:dephospho-CoA kinase
MLPSHCNLKVIGLLGGIASGKSLVAGALVRRGAVLLDADAAGHLVLREPAIEEAALARWGSSIFGPDGHIHRPALAKIVFAPPPHGPRELAYLESLTHPRIGERLRKQIDQLAADGTPRVLVLDAPVMLKAGWDEFCDLLVFVEADRPIRLQRALSRGWSEEEFARRETAQEPVEVKRSRAEIVIDNSGSVETTERQIEQLWKRLASAPPKNTPR